MESRAYKDVRVKQGYCRSFAVIDDTFGRGSRRMGCFPQNLEIALEPRKSIELIRRRILSYAQIPTHWDMIRMLICQ